jgi:pimeloyl-ACP methyl ester carboxylesterase
MTRVAIVVPGIMGSELRLNGEVIWPGSFLSLFLPYGKMNELMNPNLDATDLIRTYSVSTQYAKLIEDLERCGFRENDAKPTLFVCPYDWRKDNALSAKTLADVIDKAFNTHPGNAEISLIAHSMGGLISRYYLESGDFNARPGFASVRQLITLGTPHRGAGLALAAAVGMEKRLFLSAEQVKQLVSDVRYPALYQLLPPVGEPFVWDEEKTSEFGTIDIYDQQVAQTLGLVQQNLQAAKDFHAKLDMAKRPVNQGKPVRYFFFVGTHQNTISYIRLLKTPDNKYRVRKVELEGAGDGTVPSWSGAITGVQGQPVGGEHSTIYFNDDLRRTMGVLLGKAGVLAAAPERVEVSIRERVVNPNQTVHLTLGFASGVDKISGELRVQRMLLDANGNPILDANNKPQFANPVSVHPISYAGLNAEKLSVMFPAPAFTGLFRIAYFPNGSNESIGSDELFVQEA